jgi:signal transduction histidine kinase
MAVRPSLPELGRAAALAGGLSLGTLGAATQQHGMVRPLDVWAFVLIALSAVVTVGLRRTTPVWGLAASMVTVSAYLMAGYPYGPVQLCMIISMFEVARQRALRVSLPACGVAAVAASLTVLSRLVGEIDVPVLLSVAWTGWIILPWSLGALVNSLTTARKRARQELVARVALEERMRMAGDVHDVAGHGFAVVAMQAGVALLVLDEQPEQARASLEAIRATSVKSLAELRTMLDTFHRATPPSAPPPPPAAAGPPESVDATLADLDALVDHVRSGGLPVELEVGTMDTKLAEDVGTVAYRVVQESLTNVLRHAGPTTATVRISLRGGELCVRVADTGRASPRTPPHPGRGLTGMRGRVEDIGGRLETGPRESGGFRVVAYLPLTGGAR